MTEKGTKGYAVITGSNRGIGKALVEAFAKEGYGIFACARIQDEGFEQRLQKLTQDYSVEIIPIYFDLAEEEDIKIGVKSILSAKKRIDVLVNNAGVAHGGVLSMTTIQDMKQVYAVNVFAPVLLMQMFSRYMMRQKNGTIINMCSVGGLEHNAGYLAYGSSKASLIWMTKSLAKELAPFHIRVNGIAPGLVDTDMGSYKSDEELQKVLERTPMKRMGQAEEIAQAALFLASEKASYITGHILVADGGRWNG